MWSMNWSPATLHLPFFFHLTNRCPTHLSHTEANSLYSEIWPSLLGFLSQGWDLGMATLLAWYMLGLCSFPLCFPPIVQHYLSTMVWSSPPLGSWSLLEVKVSSRRVQDLSCRVTMAPYYKSPFVPSQGLCQDSFNPSYSHKNNAIERSFVAIQLHFMSFFSFQTIALIWFRGKIRPKLKHNIFEEWVPYESSTYHSYEFDKENIQENFPVENYPLTNKSHNFTYRNLIERHVVWIWIFPKYKTISLKLRLLFNVKDCDLLLGWG